MIRYALLCAADHGFDAWFSQSSDFDDQAARGFIECPYCGSQTIRKAIMAPAVHGVGERRAQPLEPSPGGPAPDGDTALKLMYLEMLAKVRRHVEESFDYVGDSFASEARAIHEGRSEERPIYGEATPSEVEALRKDDIPVAPLPMRPPRKSALN